jgi:ACS family glucarate transporter-like MFS transporter
MSANAARPTSVRWLIFALACFASWLLYLHRYAWGVIKPEFRSDFPQFSDRAVGWLDSAFLATYAIGQIPGGMAGDRFGPRAVLGAMMLAWSLASVAVAWAGGFWPVVGARAAFGLAQAGAYPVLSKMSRTWFPPASRTALQGIMTAMGRIGAACAPPIIATYLLARFGLSWQTALLVISVPGIVLAGLWWLAVRDSPRAHPWTNWAERKMLDHDVPPPASHDESPDRLNMARRPAMQLTGASLFSLAMLLLYAFTSTFQDQFYVFWLPSFLREGKHLDNTTMGLFAPLPFLGGAVGGMFGGALNDALIRRWGNRRWSRSLVGFTGKSMAAVLVLASLAVEDGRWAMVVLLTARIFGDWSLPTQWGAVTDMSGRAAGTVFGLVNMVGVIGGVAAGPVFGILKEAYDWDGQFFGVAAMCALAATCWLFIDCTRRLVTD